MRQDHTVILNSIIWFVETCLQTVHGCHSYLWHLFRCVMDSYCCLLNSPLRITLIALFHYMCLYYCLSSWNNSVLLTPQYWIKSWMIFLVTSVCKFKKIKLRKKFPSSSGINFLDCLSFKSYHSWCWIYYICLWIINLLCCPWIIIMILLVVWRYYV